MRRHCGVIAALLRRFCVVLAAFLRRFGGVLEAVMSGNWLLPIRVDKTSSYPGITRRLLEDFKLNSTRSYSEVYEHAES